MTEGSRKPVHQPWQPWRRPNRRCRSLLAGSITIAPRLKEALERAAVHAERRNPGVIDPATLLLGTLEVTGAWSNRVLRRTGLDPALIASRLGDHT
ncbi:MAG TPA: hypothetical protein VJS45_02520 [Acidimicrobiia bacterium]|nr:hypothetical protein [Acidimicrobiia bacterium]